MRDEISPSRKEQLARRVGYRCSNPGCKRPTIGPHTSDSKSVSIGVASHITAASAGGPRYDHAITSDERGSISNAIWLCQACAKLIDSDTVRYSHAVLTGWKKAAEESIRKTLEAPFSPPETEKLLTVVEWNIASANSYVITARLANSGPGGIAIVKTAFVRVFEFREHPDSISQPFYGAAIRDVHVATLSLPLERKGLFIWLKPHRSFPQGEVEDITIHVDPPKGYQFLFSFGFHWEAVGEKELKELEVGYLMGGQRGSTQTCPPPASQSHKPTMGNPNIDAPVILKLPTWPEL